MSTFSAFAFTHNTDIANNHFPINILSTFSVKKNILKECF